MLLRLVKMSVFILVSRVDTMYHRSIKFLGFKFDNLHFLIEVIENSVVLGSAPIFHRTVRRFLFSIIHLISWYHMAGPSVRGTIMGLNSYS